MFNFYLPVVHIIYMCYVSRSVTILCYFFVCRVKMASHFLHTLLLVSVAIIVSTQSLYNLLSRLGDVVSVKCNKKPKLQLQQSHTKSGELAWNLGGFVGFFLCF